MIDKKTEVKIVTNMLLSIAWEGTIPYEALYEDAKSFKVSAAEMEEVIRRYDSLVQKHESTMHYHAEKVAKLIIEGRLK